MPPAAASHGFAFEHGSSGDLTLTLRVSPPGSRAAPAEIWSQTFDTIDDLNAVLEASYDGGFDLGFYGRLTMLDGGDELDGIIVELVLDARDARRAEVEKALETARQHQIVHLLAPDTKRGHALELHRKSRAIADWRVVYSRASERDRLLDWLRWQQHRYLDFLDHAAQHGDETLARLLIGEMFETERRIKDEGRGAGGMRPLRMWRGD